MQEIIKVEHLSHRYSVQWAVKDVNFVIPAKGIYGLLGSNGAGKSTLMNIICGVLKPSKGTVYINGIDLNNDSVSAKQLLGFLPQQPPLHMDLTVEEYLTHCAGLRLIEKEDTPQAVEKAMERCKITHFRNRLIRNLSGGYQQRVGIAQAIIHEPQLVVFDEPTNGLDPNQILEIRNLIREIAQDRTVILSTHILSEVQAVCNQILMIEEGTVVFDGSVDDFDNYIRPNTIFVSMLEAPRTEELESIEGVLHVEPLGGTKYRLTVRDTAELIERVIETSVAHHWRINEITPERSSLDTIFAELSKKSKKIKK